MLYRRFSKLLLVVLALVLWAGTAYASTGISATGAAVAFTKGGSTNPTGTSTISITSGTDVAYTLDVATAQITAPWLLSVSCTNNSVATSTASDDDTCSATADYTIAAHMKGSTAGRPYAVNVPLTVTGSNPVETVNLVVTLTITDVATPLSIQDLSGNSITQVNLVYIKSGPINQTQATYTAAVYSDDVVADTINAPGSLPSSPAWLTVTNCTTASLSTPALCTFTVNTAAAVTAALTPSATALSASLTFGVTGVTPTLAVTVKLIVVANQPLTVTVSAPALAFKYVQGLATPPTPDPLAAVTGDAKATYAGVTLPLAVDLATVPVWLTVNTTAAATSTVTGNIVFTPIPSVVQGLNSGYYSGTVKIFTPGAAEYSIPVSLTVTASPASIFIKENIVSPVAVALLTGAANPVIPLTLTSTNESVAFTASCIATTTDTSYVPAAYPTCYWPASASIGKIATTNSVAYSWGTLISPLFDPNVFQKAHVGAVITVQITITGGQTNGAPSSPIVVVYQYTMVPGDPAFATTNPVSPAATNHIAAATSLVVTLNGTGFVAPGSIIGNAVVGTQVFVGSINETNNSVVLNANTILVSIPEADFPDPSVKPQTLVVGVANQTGVSAPAVPVVTQTIAITTGPVILSVTSTATFTMPVPGSLPKVAPFELVSIFGAQFGPDPTLPVAGVIDANNKFVSSLNITGSNNLQVNFKVGSTSYPAPILYASATQINAMVPSGLAVGSNPNVTVSYGGTTPVVSANFPVTVVAADPGIFTMSSSGTGQGAILNPDGSINAAGSASTRTVAGQVIAIYTTGLGFPNSTAGDLASNVGGYSGGCVSVTNSAVATPGYLEVVNKSVPTAKPPYVAPSPVWKNLDGAVFQPSLLLGNSLPPCFVNSGSTAVSVTFGPAGSQVTQSGKVNMLYAGFVNGSVVGLYQINVVVPAGFADTDGVPIQVNMGTGAGQLSSPAGIVTVAIGH